MVGEGTRGGREGRREGGSKVMVGEGTRGGREGGKEGGSKVMVVGEGTRGGRERRREGESKGRERGSKDATHARSVSGGREG